ncbi:hypothetical protein G6F57_009764 [Rhizopus arrhizus]|uniref:BZIP domain-containing protein n=1 Tax=Rhizopus oryzae TaxID=64495 RepID=A0A9P7BMH0_RHIOR|nr:hypothetical protein G6F30_011690 [Rhizopus arrhizus]KAG1403746.1 hypothetical protein G6F58_010314 [Rhizopus delemar]KAG0976814.1 hypothetical protein G6F29_010530 [Rhizopus arrhizus]KAG0981065.1 hypothetical protein G6F28_011492 [Rhizopus arrhizus]KAG1002776.1 hypothetical protein G6F27_011654 [Rhizopus arrhizus]
MFDELNQSKMKEEPNPFEQSFASARSSKFEFVQYKWDTCSYKSSMSSSVDSDDTVQQKKPKTKHRKRAPKKFENEEQRRDFLERNRLAALKCRQRKKQWLSNLQTRVDYLTQDNQQLELEANELKQEILNLKQLLLTHKDCSQYNLSNNQEKQHIYQYLTSKQPNQNTFV